MHHRRSIAFGLVAFIALFLWAVPASHSGRPHLGDGFISLYNVHLDEVVSIKYRKANGRYIRKNLKKINYALRCRKTQKITAMKRDLIELVDEIQDYFGGKTVYVISGYRSPELNHELFVTGRRVAKNSPHMYGQAMDISIEGIPTSQLRNIAYHLDVGGVGYYPSNKFVHVDVGLKRHW